MFSWRSKKTVNIVWLKKAFYLQICDLKKQCGRQLVRSSDIPGVSNFYYFYLFSDKKSGTLVLILELMDMNIYELIRGKFK